MRDDLFSNFDDLVSPTGDLALGNSIESGYVRSYFSGRDWQSIDVESLREGYPGDPAACLSFMTHDAFCYFFPSYLRMAYLEYETADAIFDCIIGKLHAVAFGDLTLRRVFEAYEPHQLSAIAEIVSRLSEKYCKYYPRDLAAEAFAEYWSKHLSS